jgi:hypothetical protein
MEKTAPNLKLNLGGRRRTSDVARNLSESSDVTSGGCSGGQAHGECEEDIGSREINIRRQKQDEQVGEKQRTISICSDSSRHLHVTLLVFRLRHVASATQQMMVRGRQAAGHKQLKISWTHFVNYKESGPEDATRRPSVDSSRRLVIPLTIGFDTTSA